MAKRNFLCGDVCRVCSSKAGREVVHANHGHCKAPKKHLCPYCGERYIPALESSCASCEAFFRNE